MCHTLSYKIILAEAEKELNSQVKEEDLVCETQDHPDPCAVDAEDCCKKASLKGSSNDIDMKDSNTEAKDDTSMNICDTFNTSSTDGDIDIKEFDITSMEDQNNESFERWHQSDADEVESSSCEKQIEEEVILDPTVGYDCTKPNVTMNDITVVATRCRGNFVPAQRIQKYHFPLDSSFWDFIGCAIIFNTKRIKDNV